MRENIDAQSGFLVIDDFLGEEECTALLRAVEAYVGDHDLPEIHRELPERSLRYSVIDGLEIRERLPALWKLAHEDVLARVRDAFGENLRPLEDVRVRVNVNLMRPGRSEYRWHYDRNRASALVYLNAVRGGETELYPNYRLLLPGAPGRLQRFLDSVLHHRPVRAIFSRKRAVAPVPGRLLVFRGDRCWHSVRPVNGDTTRINLVCAFDRPGAKPAGGSDLDTYLYSDEEPDRSDPNYS